MLEHLALGLFELMLTGNVIAKEQESGVSETTVLSGHLKSGSLNDLV